MHLHTLRLLRLQLLLQLLLRRALVPLDPDILSASIPKRFL